MGQRRRDAVPRRQGPVDRRTSSRRRDERGCSAKTPQPGVPLKGGALTDKIFESELGAYLRLCESVDTPRSLCCYLLAKHGEWGQYVDLPPPTTVGDDFIVDYGVTEMMRKNPRLPLDVKRDIVALNAFMDSERLCRETNERFREYNDAGFNAIPAVDPELSDVLTRTRNSVASILGELTREKLERLEESFRFGPGATSDVSGRDVLLSKKMMPCNYGITPRLCHYWAGFGWHNEHPTLLNEVKVTTVPKNAKTDRTIGIEPHWNVYVQLGIGSLIRHQLLRSGLITRDQSINRRLASVAHKHGLATIDLSSASDTIASEVVLWLLPPKWFHLLHIARTDNARLPDGTALHLEKFSSMGNGFTWELETLIFYAISKSVCQSLSLPTDEVGTFGDDIIVPSRAMPLLVRTLEFFGFRVNSKKSFWQGDFYESCGHDYYRGMNIRPFYFKGEYHDFDSFVVRAANGLRRYAARLGFDIYCDKRVFRAYRYLLARSDVARKTGISEGYGDDGLIRNFDEALPLLARSRRGFEGFLGVVLRRHPKLSKRTVPLGALYAALRFGAVESMRSTEYIRGETHAPKLSRQLIPHWRDLGPWL